MLQKSASNWKPSGLHLSICSSIAFLLSQLWALKVSISYSVRRTDSSGLQKIRGYSLRKLRHQGDICWLWKQLFWQYGLVHTFFWNKAFFCQDFVWFRILWNLTKFQLIQTTFIPHRKNFIWMLSERAEILRIFTKF